MNETSTLAGAIRYEFLMQVRRPSLWIVFALLSILAFGPFASELDSFGKLANPATGARLFTHRDLALLWTQSVAQIWPLGAGLLLADRTPRDRRTKVIELLRTAPASTLSRLLGKYLGAVLATLVPISVVHLLALAVVVVRLGDASVLPESLAGFAAFVLPAVFFVGAFSIACTTLLWTPLYQFLFVGYFLWNGLNPAEAIPTLNNTFLSPTENYVASGLFHLTAPFAADAGRYPPATIWQAFANMGVLLACGLVALLAAWRLEVARVARA